MIRLGSCVACRSASICFGAVMSSEEGEEEGFVRARKGYRDGRGRESGQECKLSEGVSSLAEDGEVCKGLTRSQLHTFVLHGSGRVARSPSALLTARLFTVLRPEFRVRSGFRVKGRGFHLSPCGLMAVMATDPSTALIEHSPISNFSQNLFDHTYENALCPITSHQHSYVIFECSQILLCALRHPHLPAFWMK